MFERVIDPAAAAAAAAADAAADAADAAAAEECVAPDDEGAYAEEMWCEDSNDYVPSD